MWEFGYEFRIGEVGEFYEGCLDNCCLGICVVIGEVLNWIFSVKIGLGGKGF